MWGGKIARTIKANYWKMSPANFFARNGYAATFVVEYEQEIIDYGFTRDIARCIKSTYGRCGGASFLYSNGWMIQGILEYE